MTTEQIRKCHLARPFKPFSLRLSDGREYGVSHPESMIFFQSGRTIVVAAPDDTLEVIDLLLVASLHLEGGNRKGGRGDGRTK